MVTRAIDILLFFVSGIISIFISAANPGANNAEMDALWLYVIPAIVTVGVIVIFVVFHIFFRRFYNKYRWWIAGILCFINLLSGLYMYFYQLPN